MKNYYYKRADLLDYLMNHVKELENVWQYYANFLDSGIMENFLNSGVKKKIEKQFVLNFKFKNYKEFWRL